MLDKDSPVSLYYVLIFGPFLILFGGVIIGLLASNPSLTGTPLHYAAIVGIIVGIFSGLGVARKVEKEIELLQLRIRILELEKLIKDLEEKLK